MTYPYFPNPPIILLVVVLVVESKGLLYVNFPTLGLLYKVMEFKVLSRDLYYESRDKPSQ